jgi:hypothetical protein
MAGHVRKRRSGGRSTQQWARQRGPCRACRSGSTTFGNEALDVGSKVAAPAASMATTAKTSYSVPASPTSTKSGGRIVAEQREVRGG